MTNRLSLLHLAAGFAFVMLVAAPGVKARVLRVTIAKKDPAFHGQAFGKTGAYEVIRGTAAGEIDPAERRNAVITDIQFAPRNANGKVSYTTTFSILKPADMTKANGTMVYDVTNRGNPRFASRFTRFVLANGPPDLELADAGDGSVYKAGYVVVTSGWQGDVTIDAVSPGREGITVPVAKNPDGSSITGRVVVRFAAGAPGNGVVGFSGNVNTLALPGPGRTPATMDTASAKLVSKASEAQSGESGGVVPVASTDWAFADCRNTPFPCKPDPARLCLKNGFDPARLYELVYTAKDPFVLGVGLAALRDVVSYFRHEANGNPLAGRIKHVIGYGVSQPARMMRDFINLGFNEDEMGRPAWD